MKNSFFFFYHPEVIYVYLLNFHIYFKTGKENLSIKYFYNIEYFQYDSFETLKNMMKFYSMLLHIQKRMVDIMTNKIKTSYETSLVIYDIDYFSADI